MPAKSKSQRRVMAMALNQPQKLFKRNRGLLSMTKKQLDEFASTSEKKLPRKVRRKKSQRSKT